MTRFRLPLLAGCLFATSIAWGASTPQSFLDGNPQTKTSYLYKVRIIAVDGDSQNGNPIAVTPGPHWLTVLGPNGNKMGTLADKPQTVVLKIQPCTYYYLGARKDSELLKTWKLVVDSEETMVGCNPDDELKKAQAAAKTAPPVRATAQPPVASPAASPASH